MSGGQEMKKIFILLFILLLRINAYASNVPYKEVALRIHNLPYDKHTTNCLIKSNLFCEFLKSKGIEAKVIIGKIKGQKFYRHAWIEYKQNNKWYIIDLTDNPRSWGFEKSNYYWIKEKENV